MDRTDGNGRVAAEPRIACFGYHEVTDEPSGTGFQRPGARPFTLSRRSFQAHLDAIAAGPMTPTLVDAVDFDRPGDHLLLTFDDGGKSAVYAGDALASRGWRGHFFVVTGLVGTRTFLDWAAIRYLHSCGHLLGSHSHTHPGIFKELSRRQMAAEWATSTALLGDRLGAPCTTASIPGGDISPTVLTAAAEAGFRHLFTIEPNPYPSLVGTCRVLGRFLPKRHTNAAQIGDLVRFRGWEREHAIRRAKVWARRLLPGLYRHLVRRRTTSSEGASL